MARTCVRLKGGPADEREHIEAVRQERLFFSGQETASLLGIHRTTLRALALGGRAPIEPVPITVHKRVYRRVDVERLAGIAE